MAEATLAYYLRGPKIARSYRQAQIRVRPTYVMYNRKDDTSDRFRLPETPCSTGARGHSPGRRAAGPRRICRRTVAVAPAQLPRNRRSLRPAGATAGERLTQETWIRLGGIYSFWGTQRRF